jgi:hypothetical protein
MALVLLLVRQEGRILLVQRVCVVTDKAEPQLILQVLWSKEVTLGSS